MSSTKNADVKYQNAKLFLFFIGIVTIVDLILQAVKVRLTFPCSIYFSQWILSKSLAGEIHRAIGIPAAILPVLLFLFLFLLTVLKRFDKINPVRIALILYTADSVFYFAMAASSILSDGLSAANIIEFAFRIFILYMLYKSDKELRHPTQETETDKKEEIQKTNPDDSDDEGIQW